MTGGVVALGKTGRNFAAGMSGGVAYVFNPENLFERQCNLSLVELSLVAEASDVAQLKSLIERHAALTKSATATRILAEWDESLPHFVKVMSVEYKKVLEQRRLRAPREVAVVADGG